MGKKVVAAEKTVTGTQDFHSENIPVGGLQKFLGTVMLLLSKLKKRNGLLVGWSILERCGVCRDHFLMQPSANASPHNCS